MSNNVFHQTIEVLAVVVEKLSSDTTLIEVTEGDYRGYQGKIRNSKFHVEGIKIGDSFMVGLEVDSTTKQPMDITSLVPQIGDDEEQSTLFEVDYPEPEYDRVDLIHSTDEFYIAPDNVDRLNILASIMRDEGQANALILGPSGWGKTELGPILAEQLDLRWVYVNMANIVVGEEFFGSREFDDRTKFTLHDHVTLIEEGDCVVVLDEVTRVQQFMLGPVFPLLDARRETTVNHKYIECGPNLMFLMTANRGHRYTGTEELDEAFLNRAQSILYIDEIPVDEEINLLMSRVGISKKAASMIADFMVFLRMLTDDVDASIRMSLYLAAQIKYGASLKDAVETLIFNRRMLTDETTKTIIDAIQSRS